MTESEYLRHYVARHSEQRTAKLLGVSLDELSKMCRCVIVIPDSIREKLVELWEKDFTVLRSRSRAMPARFGTRNAGR